MQPNTFRQPDWEERVLTHIDARARALEHTETNGKNLYECVRERVHQIYTTCEYMSCDDNVSVPYPIQANHNHGTGKDFHFFRRSSSSPPELISNFALCE